MTKIIVNLKKLLYGLIITVLMKDRLTFRNVFAVLKFNCKIPIDCQKLILKNKTCRKCASIMPCPLYM